MRALAFRKISVLKANGTADPGSYIASGDWCSIGGKTLGGLFPVTYPTKSGGKTRWVRSLSGFLCNQNAYPALSYPARGYERATIKSSGCGVCACVNAIGAVTGKQVSVLELRNLSIACGARVPGGTNMRTLIAQVCSRYGMRYTTTSSVQLLLAHLKTGGAAICNVAGRGMFSTGGHYMAVLGLLDGKLCIADPGLYSGKFSKGARRQKVSVSGDLIFAAPETLDADCIGRRPRYYLLEKQG